MPATESAATAAAETRAALLRRGQALLASEPGIGRFLTLAVEAADPEDVAAYGAKSLEAIFRASFARIAKRGDSAAWVEISAPEGKTKSPPQIIDIVTRDTPFIVDSVLAAIRARGGVIRLMTHPVLPFDPRTAGLFGTVMPDAERLSFLHVHIDPVADAAAMQAEIEVVLGEVACAVKGWRPMLERLRLAIEDLRQRKPRMPAAVLAEAMHFLGWLADHNFTFLGMREYRLKGSGKALRLEPVKDGGLGILEDAGFKFLRSGTAFVEMTEQHVAFLQTPGPLLVTKANVRSRVHRRSHMDYVGVKLYGDDGAVSGELRILGLFTSMSLATPHSEVPLIRRKIAEVMKRSDFAPQSHAGKALMAALDTYPRDELFQIEEDQLFEFAGVIAALADRPRIRVLARIDRFDNFVSVLLYVPRERYNSDVRARIADHLAMRYDGRVSAYYPHFLEGDLVRAHIIIGRNGGPTPRPVREALEAEVADLTRNFGDLLLAAAPDPAAVADYRNAFSPAYQSRNTAADALADIAVLVTLGDTAHIAMRLSARDGRDGGLGLKVFHRETAIPLSDRVPMLEHFGFRVIDERTYTIHPRDGVERYLHDMVLAPADGVALDVAALGPRIETALLAVWDGLAESDGFNQLTIRAGLAWHDVAILRALARYLRQIGLSYSQRYLAAVLSTQPMAAIALCALFHTLNDPAFAGGRDAAAEDERKVLAAALEATTSLDEDRILRRFLNLVEASLRTNAYQRAADGARRPALAIKFDCVKIDGLPEPRPFREIFVYAPRVEGVHLRFGAIARGGLRWSDRPEDFRTEVLGLVKAQQVKNAVIVPVGAKGGFVPKAMPAGADRETVQAEGVACYRIFVSTLLDVTDNLDGDKLVPPQNVLRRDGDDPYLVVAADKGTASFSDIANAIALEKHFWLGDAFASGGSVGYDHKKMGITARGAFESVKRHFRELDRDIMREEFTTVGVGDMSGDVFGNGMLLSPATRLIAAFDHRDIFIDPDPDPAKSLLERQRLFALPRSSWQDYNKALLSRGGGIFPRAAKSIPLSPEIRAALELKSTAATPAEVMTAILKADVDLLWFGGIGTYVRSVQETDLNVGDRANDAIRITGRDIRARAVGEGANLAMTQRARIDYALNGGRINTDAIDNSAGVNSSDLEVNIKIALGTLVRAKQLSTGDRNTFLASMTGEVAALCLRNNYLQSLAISLTERRGMAEFPDHVDLMLTLEARGQLNRAVEFLPDDITLAERASAHTPLTRPELAVLLAYAKLTLYADLLASPVLDDPYLGKELFRYFPEKLAERYPETISGHRLKREVIATVLANAMVNRGGPAFVNEMMAASSADAGQVAFAYAAARDAYDLAALNTLIDRLDGTAQGATQLTLYAEVEALLVRETLWFLRNASFTEGLAGLIGRHARGVAELRSQLPSLLPPVFADAIGAKAAAFQQGGAPTDVARRVAELSALSFATDIVLIGERAKVSIDDAAKAFFGVLETFNLGAIIAAGRDIVLADRFDRMALDRALANLMRAQRDLSTDVLAQGSSPIGKRLAGWRAARPAAIDRVIAAVADLTEGELTVSRLSVAAGLLADLARGS